MKFRLLLLIGIMVSLQSVISAQDEIADRYMKFDSTQIDLGQINKTDKLSFEFKFINISNEDIEIDLVSACECSEVTWPWKPIKPNEEGVIKVIFDPSKKESEEVITLDVNLINADPKTGYPIFKTLNYTYDFDD